MNTDSPATAVYIQLKNRVTVPKGKGCCCAMSLI